MENKMNTLKRFNLSIALLLTILIFLTSNHLAQERKRKGPPPIPDETQIAKMVEDLSVELSLNEDQKTRLHELYIVHFNEVKEKMEMDKEALKAEKGKDHRKMFEESIKKLLTEEQQVKFDEFIKKNRPEQRNKSKEPRDKQQ